MAALKTYTIIDPTARRRPSTVTEPRKSVRVESELSSSYTSSSDYSSSYTSSSQKTAERKNINDKPYHQNSRTITKVMRRSEADARHRKRSRDRGDKYRDQKSTDAGGKKLNDGKKRKCSCLEFCKQQIKPPPRLVMVGSVMYIRERKCDYLKRKGKKCPKKRRSSSPNSSGSSAASLNTSHSGSG